MVDMITILAEILEVNWVYGKSKHDELGLEAICVPCWVAGNLFCQGRV